MGWPLGMPGALDASRSAVDQVVPSKLSSASIRQYAARSDADLEQLQGSGAAELGLDGDQRIDRRAVVVAPEVDEAVGPEPRQKARDDHGREHRHGGEPARPASHQRAGSSARAAPRAERSPLADAPNRVHEQHGERAREEQRAEPEAALALEGGIREPDQRGARDEREQRARGPHRQGVDGERRRPHRGQGREEQRRQRGRRRDLLAGLTPDVVQGVTDRRERLSGRQSESDRVREGEPRDGEEERRCGRQGRQRQGPALHERGDGRRCRGRGDELPCRLRAHEHAAEHQRGRDGQRGDGG